MSLTFQS